jgi:hypothetical protein
MKLSSTSRSICFPLGHPARLKVSAPAGTDPGATIVWCVRLRDERHLDQVVRSRHHPCTVGVARCAPFRSVTHRGTNELAAARTPQNIQSTRIDARERIQLEVQACTCFKEAKTAFQP